ncbi:MAG: Sulfatase [Candidatus Uhrbacteria bacterium GW2011_GWF2_39_13]|uniref:Sulfatase n=1 Tax=Candidatus Uhrbacteria bacterium GW2011_GWF2_39_13 TaxID=1618995 RepID=A0A0G0QSW8_9BACT|nr:MAG: Sulfatase [Candidatus Uhrbacteria bacterium GW2011_GWF2_39_13]
MSSDEKQKKKEPLKMPLIEIGNKRMIKKNILFFMTDQLLWNALGYAGHPIVKTPNLDRLAQKSLNFPNAFCVSPVCVPARISLFCGQYPHKHGQATNLPVKEGTKMFIETLTANGYHTAAVGKLHLMPISRETKRFKTLKLHDGYSKAEESDYVKYLEKVKPEYAPLNMHGYPEEKKEGVISGKNAITGEKYETIILGTSKVPKEYFYTQFISDKTIEFLETCNKENPFFLFVSFLGPHSPFIVPEPYNTLYNPDDIPVPETVKEDLSSKPKSQYQRRSLWGMEYVSNEQLQKITSLYYAHITLIDEHVGKILKRLEELNLYDDTIIVFSSDHGEFLGNHGLFYKGAMYDEATKIPLLIHDTEMRSSRKIDELVSQIDIMPTLLDLVNIPLPEWNQGKSLKPLIDGKVSSVRDEVFFEIRNADDGLGYNIAPGYIVGCRDKDYLFSYEVNKYHDLFEGELYDLKKDPRQINNLYNKTEYKGKNNEFKERILNWFIATQ